MKDVTLGQYFPGKSLIHRADPRTKLILTMLFVVAVFMRDFWQIYALASVYILGAIAISGVPVVYAIKGLKPIVLFIAIAAVLNLFFVEGTAFFQVWGLKMTYEGLYTALRMIIRLVLVIMAATLLTLTTTPIALTDAMESLGRPLKRIGFPMHELAMMMTIAMKFIPLLLEETDRIMKAQSSRGANFETGNIIKRAKSFVPVLVPLFVSAFRRADELASAMEARCYRGGEGRTRFKMLKFGRADVQVVLLFMAFAAAGTTLAIFL